MIYAKYVRLVERADKAMIRAVSEFHNTLLKEYPVGMKVRVCHARGKFTGTVTGHDHADGGRVWIENDETGKISKQWYRYVEPIKEQSHD